MKGFIKTFFVIALCLAAVSCSDLNSPSNEENAPLPSPAEGTIRFDIEKKDRLSRAAVPQAFLTGIYYRLTVYKADNSEQIVYTKYQNTLSFTVPDPSWKGTSIAKLEMYCPTEDKISTDPETGLIKINSSVCMTGQKSFNLVDGTRVFNFTIDLDFPETDLLGSINLPVTVENTGVKSCIIVPDYAGSDASKYIKAKIENNYITCDEVKPFSDHALFYFFKAAATELPESVSNDFLKNAVVMYSDSITVFPVTTTDKWCGSEGTEKTVYLESLQYSTMYVASDGDDKNGGSSLYPVKKLSTAIARCAQTPNGGTIYLKSQPGDTEKIVIDKSVKIENISGGSAKLSLPNIEIKNESKVSITGVKISKAEETGISVGTNCSLILSNVEVSGCEKGIYAENKCTVDLSNDSAVKNCTGYGIQLKNSSGILKISGTEVDAATAATSSFDSCDLYYPKGKVVRLNAPCSDVSKNDDILNEAFDAVGGFGNGSVLLLGNTTSNSVTWEIKENGISVTTGISGNTYTVKPVNGNCNVTIKRDSGARKQFVLLKSTAPGIWKINNFTFERGSNTTQTDTSLNSDGKGGAVYLENGTLDLTSCSFANNSAQNGGAVYIESGTVILDACTIGGSSTAVNTAAGNGGAFYLEGSSAKLVMNSGTIGNNTATLNGGAVYLAGTSTSLEMNNGAISSNTAKNGGGVYVALGAAAKIKGGLVTSNSATTAGGAVYQGGTFEVSGYTYITPGSAPKSNDVYLDSGKYVEVTGALTPKKYGSLNGSDVDYTAVITPSTWKRGTQVLSGGNAATYAGKFKGSEEDWNVVSDSSVGKFDTGTTIYVSESAISGVTGGVAGNDSTGFGTKKYPYATIQKAAKETWREVDFTISINGTLTATAIENSDTETGVGCLQQIPSDNNIKAKTITLTGTNSATINAASKGCALTISKAVPVTIQKITIKGGNATNGGGIYCSAAGASLTLGEGAVVTGNKSSNGGGVYISGTGTDAAKLATLTLSSTAKISGNTAQEDDGTDGPGGGVYAKYANVYISGSALIGDTDDTYTTGASSTSKSNSAASGGGIYAESSNVYIGYANSNSTGTDLGSSYGVCHNYASANGGGIYLDSSSSLVMGSGKISKNGAATNGGGIYNVGNVFLHTDALVGDARTATATNEANSNQAGTSTVNANAKGGGIYSTATGSKGVYLGYKDANHTQTLNTGKGVIGNSVSNKTFTGNDGGSGIFCNSGLVKMASGELSWNGSYQSSSYYMNGGGIYLNAGTFTMSDGTIAKNYGNCGGGVYVKSGATFTMAGGTIGDSSASNTPQNASQDSNSAVTGGGLYVEGIANLNSGIVAANYAASTSYGGGGMYVSGTATVKNTFRYNSIASSSKGNGIYCASDNCTLNGASFVKNLVYVASGKSLQLQSVSFSNNPTSDIELAETSSKVNVTAHLNGSGTVATIKPSSYAETNQVLTVGSGVTLANEVGRFAVVPNGSDNYTITTEGKLKKEVTIPESIDDITSGAIIAQYESKMRDTSGADVTYKAAASGAYSSGLILIRAHDGAYVALEIVESHQNELTITGKRFSNSSDTTGTSFNEVLNMTELEENASEGIDSCGFIFNPDEPYDDNYDGYISFDYMNGDFDLQFISEGPYWGVQPCLSQSYVFASALAD